MWMVRVPTSYTGNDGIGGKAKHVGLDNCVVNRSESTGQCHVCSYGQSAPEHWYKSKNRIQIVLFDDYSC